MYSNLGIYWLYVESAQRVKGHFNFFKILRSVKTINMYKTTAAGSLRRSRPMSLVFSSLKLLLVLYMYDALLTGYHTALFCLQCVYISRCVSSFSTINTSSKSNGHPEHCSHSILYYIDDASGCRQWPVRSYRCDQQIRMGWAVGWATEALCFNLNLSYIEFVCACLVRVPVSESVLIPILSSVHLPCRKNAFIEF